MMFGKVRLVYAGREQKNIDLAVKYMREIPNGVLTGVFTDYKEAVAFAREKGCDAAFFDCGYEEGGYLQKELHAVDKDIIASFRDRFYVDAFGWCRHEGAYEERFRNIAGACWYDPYFLPESFGYKEILDSIDKRADAKAVFHDLPDEIRQHSQRVAEMTVSAMEYAMANRLLEDTEYVQDLHIGYMDYLYEAALLHDIGKAYFEYKRDGFGPVCEDENSLLSALEEVFQSGCRMVEGYEKRVEGFYPLHDDKNCERTYEAVKALLEDKGIAC